MYLRRWQGS